VIDGGSVNWETKKILLFEYCEKYKKAPYKKTLYKDVNIGQWLYDQKKQKRDDYYKKLSVNKYVKHILDLYLNTQITTTESEDEILNIIDSSNIVLSENDCTDITDEIVSEEHLEQELLNIQKELDGSYKCKKCDHIFQTKSNYTTHLNKKLPCNKLEKITCEYCNKVFTRPYSLKVHIINTCKEKLKQENYKKEQELSDTKTEIDIIKEEYRKEIDIIKEELLLDVGQEEHREEINLIKEEELLLDVEHEENREDLIKEEFLDVEQKEHREEIDAVKKEPYQCEKCSQILTTKSN